MRRPMMPVRGSVIIVGGVICIILLGVLMNSREGPDVNEPDSAARMEDQVEQTDSRLPKVRVRAPEFPEGFAWINTDKPLRFKEELKGQIVVLDFWTYCCINCMHVLPSLAYIEEKFRNDPVVVIGVHSAKFDNESRAENVRAAVQRYQIGHPVIVDERHNIWSQFGVRAWPTIAFIDAEGKVVIVQPGEMARETMSDIISILLEEAKARGTLAEGPPDIRHDAEVASSTGLAFPGKVAADAAGNRLFIADSNHNRILIASLDGAVEAIAGSGQAGATDGTFSQASFRNPQGMAFDGTKGLLYVADTDNHLIRRLDLNNKTVTTLAGTGSQGVDRVGGKVGTEQEINSPWDAALVGGRLIIAMAGPHQLWSLDLESGVCGRWAGSGREEIIDGPPERAALAQPSGIVQLGEHLYFADSEVSALRRAEIATGNIETLIGTGLFDFGDTVGAFEETLFQHPLGVTAAEGIVYVADTYNHKIKAVDLNTRRTRELVPDEASFNLYEPGGLSIANGVLYIADTNHHRVAFCDLETNKWSELVLEGLAPPPVAMHKDGGLALSTFRVNPASQTRLRFNIEIPADTHINEDYPTRYSVSAGDLPPGKPTRIKDLKWPLEVDLPAGLLQAETDLKVAFSFGYCTDGDSSVCIPVELEWDVHVKPAPDGVGVVELTGKVEKAEMTKSDF